MDCRLFALILFVLGGCTTKDAESAPEKKPAKVAPQFVQFPTLRLQGMNPKQMQDFVKIMNEETCPCDCPKTFAGCLQEGSKCKPAIILGQWIADRMQEEAVPTDILAEALAKDVGSEGFKSQVKSIDIKGYASKGNKKNAPITIVEYADFQCTHCKDTAKELALLVQEEPTKYRVIFKHFPLEGHPMARAAAIAAEAAAQQGKFWEMHDAIFAAQTQMTEDLFAKHAKAIGLDVKRFERDRKSAAVIDRVERSIKEGKALEIKGTPALYFNGRPYHLALNQGGFRLRAEMEEGRQTASCN